MRGLAGGAALLLLALAGCRTAPLPEPASSAAAPPEAPATGWRAVVLPEDRDRIDRIALAWEAALGEARSRRAGRALRVEGDLVEPEAALPRAMPPPGPYRCRLLRFGERRAFAAFRPYFCEIAVEGDLLSLTKQEGSERPGGYLWEDGDGRLIFLGALALDREPVPPGYGERRERDLVGVVERVGEFRYRLVMPWPSPGTMLDVLELVPFVPESLQP